MTPMSAPKLMTTNALPSYTLLLAVVPVTVRVLAVMLAEAEPVLATE